MRGTPSLGALGGVDGKQFSQFTGGETGHGVSTFQDKEADALFGLRTWQRGTLMSQRRTSKKYLPVSIAVRLKQSKHVAPK